MRKKILSKRSNNNTRQNKVIIKTREVPTGKIIDVDKIISDSAKKGQLAS